MKQICSFVHLSATLCRPLAPVVMVIALGLATASATVISGFLLAATFAAAE